MEILVEVLVAIAIIWSYALIVIGTFQVIASLIRAYNVEDWNNSFGERLKLYFLMLIGYWIAAGLVVLMSEVIKIYEWMVFLFVPFLCTLLAIYYWRAVYLLYKNK